MAGAQARPRLGHLALVALVGARIEHLLGAAFEVVDHLLDVARVARIEARLERRRLRRDLSTLDLAAFGTPLLQAAIQDTDVGVSKRQEHPPHAGGRDPAAGIVQHDRIVIAYSEPADIAAEL